MPIGKKLVNSGKMLTGMAVVSCLASCQRVQAQSPELSYADVAPTTKRCVVNRILMSPSGSVAIFKTGIISLLDPIDDRVFGGSDVFFVDPHRTSLLTARSESMEVAGWLSPSRLLVRVGRAHFYEIDGSGVTSNKSRLPRTVVLEPAKYLDGYMQVQPSRDPTVIREIAFVGLHAVGTLPVRRSGDQLIVGAPPSRQSAAGISDARIYTDTSGVARWTFAGQPDLGNLPYSLPVIDYVSGFKVGVFGPKYLSLPGHPERQADVLASIPEDAGILDVSVAGPNIAVLTEREDGEKVALISGPGRPVRKVPLCRSSDTTEPVRSKLNVVALAAQDRGLPTAALLRRRLSNPQRCLIVFFRGGPDRSARHDGLSDPFRRLSQTNCDVLNADYPGSSGLGQQLSSQVRESGFGAFDVNAMILKNWVTAQRYKKVTLVGVSFGAAPALSAKKVFGHGAKLLLIAPMTSVRGGALERQATDLSGYNGNDSHISRMGNFDAFINTFYGGDKEASMFDESLAQSYTAADATTVIYAGSRDQRAPIAHLKRLAPNATFRLYPYGHEIVGGLQAVWNDVGKISSDSVVH